VRERERRWVGNRANLGRAVEIKERSLGWKKGRFDLAKEKRERERDSRWFYKL
jgi:hypothetical protein